MLDGSLCTREPFLYKPQTKTKICPCGNLPVIVPAHAERNAWGGVPYSRDKFTAVFHVDRLVLKYNLL